MPDEKNVVYLHAMISDLMVKAHKTANSEKLGTLIELYASLLRVVFVTMDDELLKAKSAALLQNNPHLEKIIAERFEK